MRKYVQCFDIVAICGLDYGTLYSCRRFTGVSGEPVVCLQLNLEDEGSILLQNVVNHVQEYMIS
jgi:hypothetical protein